GVKVGLKACLVLDASPDRVEAGSAELVEGEFRILRVVLQDEEAKRLAHGYQINERGVRLLSASQGSLGNSTGLSCTSPPRRRSHRRLQRRCTGRWRRWTRASPPPGWGRSGRRRSSDRRPAA